MPRLFNLLTKLFKFSPVVLIDGLTAILVILIALSALGISFGNLFALAGVNGFGTLEGNLWAWQIDGFVVVATLAVLRAHLTGARARYAWLLVLVTTGVSVAFNAFHQMSHPALAMVMRGLPPITLFLSFHLFMGFVGEWVQRRTLVQSIETLSGHKADLEGTVSALQQACEDIVADRDRQVSEREAKLETLKIERSEVQKDIRTGRKEVDALRETLSSLQDTAPRQAGPDAPSVQTPAERRAIVLKLVRANVPVIEIAEKLQVSAKTISRDLKALNGEVSHERA